MLDPPCHCRYLNLGGIPIPHSCRFAGTGLRSRLRVSPTYSLTSPTYQTAFMLAHQTSAAQLYANGTAISWTRFSEALPQPSATSAEDKTLAMLRVQPELAALPSVLRVYLQDNNIAVPSTITVVRSGVLSAKVEWLRDEDHLQTVHASPDIWKRKWFDSIAIRAGGPGAAGQQQGLQAAAAADQLWYGELRLLFWAGGRQLAFVRWYEVVPMTQRIADRGILQTLGCVRLKWETIGTGIHERARYDVIDFQDILKRVYVVPDFVTDNYFHVNPWKWDRGEVCKAGILVPRGRMAGDSDSDADGSVDSDQESGEDNE